MENLLELFLYCSVENALLEFHLYKIEAFENSRFQITSHQKQCFFFESFSILVVFAAVVAKALCKNIYFLIRTFKIEFNFLRGVSLRAVSSSLLPSSSNNSISLRFSVDCLMGLPTQIDWRELPNASI